jgi:Tetratricopeptide repeat/SEC-C motif
MRAICSTTRAPILIRRSRSVANSQRASGFVCGIAERGINHSNDVRSTVITEYPVDRMLNPGITSSPLGTDPLLVRTRGAEVGVRTKAVQGLDSSVSLFFLDQASELVFNALGSEHPDTAVVLSNLALLLQAQGDLAGARPLFERALAIREKAFGSEHPDTVVVRDNVLRLNQAALPRNQRDPTTWGNVRRNEPCPCGSAKRYKHCHGSLGPSLSVQTRRDLT